MGYLPYKLVQDFFHQQYHPGFRNVLRQLPPGGFLFILQPTLIVLFLGGFSLEAAVESGKSLDTLRRHEFLGDDRFFLLGAGQILEATLPKKRSFFKLKVPPQKFFSWKNHMLIFFLRKLTHHGFFVDSPFLLLWKKKNGDAVWPFFFESKIAVGWACCWSGEFLGEGWWVGMSLGSPTVIIIISESYVAPNQRVDQQPSNIETKNWDLRNCCQLVFPGNIYVS